MKEIPGESIDLIVTSPPYDNLRAYNDQNDWCFEKFKSIAREISRIIKEGGVIVWNVSDATIKGSETGSSFRQALFFKDECGLNIHDTMIWKKTHFVPLTHNRYEQSFEYMFIFSNGKPKTFNPIKVPCSSFGITRSTNKFRKSSKDEFTRVEGYSVSKNKIKENSWVIAPETSSAGKGHPAVFPVKLASDHIISWSNPGDTVMDPFTGSGTTGVACKNLNRNFIGIERDDKYFDIAKERIEKA